MISISEKRVLERILTWTALVATLLVLPWSSYDPINVPKLAVIAVGGFMAAALLISNLSIVKQRQFRLLTVASGLFLIDLLLVLIFSGSNFYQELFGTFGRATGVVAYVSLTFLALAAAYISSISTMKKIAYTLVIAGLLSNLYGLIQALGLDPILWNNQYSPVFGFLGNPNFQSSFIGFSGILVFAYSISAQFKVAQKVAGLIYLVLTAYVIKETDSQQGFLVLLGGIGIVLLILLLNSKFVVLKVSFVGLSVIGLFLVIVGSLNKGPLASLLYKPSVTYRGDYWQAGWKMTVENPVLGVGLDSYGDWYRRARTVEATLRRGPEITSNAAHNVLLDLSSNGGFPLLIIYLFILMLAFRSVFKLIKRSSSFDPTVAGLIAVWFAFLAQSIISLNQLGLAVWGWIITGLIIGYEINTRDTNLDELTPPKAQKGKSAKAIASEKVSPKSFVVLTVGLLLGLLAGLPSLIGSSNFYSAVKSGDALKVEQAAYSWPQDPNRMGQIAITLANNNLQEQALKILENGVSKFPDEFTMWRLLSEMPNASAEQVAKAKTQMKRLDPHNPDLK